MAVPNARFNELLTDIEPSPTTVGRASAGHKAIRDHLRYHEEFGERYVDSFLSGSYARDTSIRPRKTEDGVEKPDVDIIVVTDYTEDDAPVDVLKAVCEALSDGYEVERINRRSVRVETWQADMDIVPVFELTSGGYMIADRESGTWKYTNPPMHSQWSAEKNKEFSDRFKPLVKLFKWWRRINPSGRRPKGFVLEVLVGKHAPKGVVHYGEAFAQTLENIHGAYATLAELGQKPFIADPADPSNDILSKVTLPQWKDFVEKVRVYADVARRAQDTDGMEKATGLWRRVFGERFKATATVAKAATASSFAAAPVASVGYTFPDSSAAPAATPRSFA